MKVIVFYKNGNAEARIVSGVFVDSCSVAFNVNGNLVMESKHALNNIKKIMVDGVTVWEEEEWIKQEKELEKGEWVCVKKDRLEELIEAAYDYSIFCAVYGTKACRLNDKKTSCSVCEYGYDKVRDDYEPPVNTVLKWLEGEENEDHDQRL